MSKITLTTVGCGFFSRFHHEAWQRLEIDHVGICDRNTEQAQSFSDEYGGAPVFSDLKTMLIQTSPDLVDLILPPPQHLESIRLAAAYGANVICQKPFTCSQTEAREAIALSGKAGIEIVVHENFRFQPWYGQIKKMIKDGHLGRIYEVRFDLRPGDGRGKEAYLDRQPYFQKMDRFLIRETGIHFIDVFRYLLGEPVSVWSDLRRLNPAISGEDAGIFILGFEDGVRAVFDGNRLADHAAGNHRLTMGEMRIEGDRGTLRLDGFGRLYFRSFGSIEEAEVAYAWRDNCFGGDCVYRLQKHVLDHFERGAPLQNRADSYLINQLIEDAIYTSHSDGCRKQFTTPQD